MHAPHTRTAEKDGSGFLSGAVAALSRPRAPRQGKYGRGWGLRCEVSSLPAPVISPHPVPRTAEGAAAAARDAVSMAMRDCIMLLTKLHREKDAPGESPVPSAAPSPPFPGRPARHCRPRPRPQPRHSPPAPSPLSAPRTASAAAALVARPAERRPPPAVAPVPLVLRIPLRARTAAPHPVSRRGAPALLSLLAGNAALPGDGGGGAGGGGRHRPVCPAANSGGGAEGRVRGGGPRPPPAVG